MARVGRYELLGKLGQGGMAEVFLARDSLPGAERYVVIKRLLPEHARSERFVRMFSNEARSATRLRRPNSAHLYEFGESEGRHYLMMELVHGVSLAALLQRSADPSPPPLAALIGSRVAAALHHAHQLTDLEGNPLGIVHRDISPQNIHLSFEGVVKVLDFGIAKASFSVDTTRSGEIKGKCAYMAPEQVEDKRLVDRRTDVFALGIVLHEILSHERLFRRETTAQTLWAVCSSEIPPLPKAPPELAQIVMRALEREMDKRYPTARELQQDLDRVLCDHPATEVDLESFLTGLFGEGSASISKLIARFAAQAPRPVCTLTLPPPGAAPEKPPRSRLRSRLRLGAILLGLGAVGLALGLSRNASGPAARLDATSLATTADRGMPPATRAVSLGLDASSPRADAATSAHRDPIKTHRPPRKGSRPDAATASLRAKDSGPRKIGWLTLSSTPWALVTLDGKGIGVTPIYRLPVEAGRHTLSLANRERGLEKTLEVTILEGQLFKQTVQLEAPVP